MRRKTEISTQFEGDGRLILNANIANGWHPFPKGGRGFSQSVTLDLPGDWTVRTQLKFEAVNIAQHEYRQAYLAARSAAIQLSRSKGKTLADAAVEADGVMAKHELPDPHVARYPQQDAFPEDLEGEASGRGFHLKLCQTTATVIIDLIQAFDRIVGPSGKHGIYGEPTKIALKNGFAYKFSIWIIFTPPIRRPLADIRERDLLPFLPGGLPETNRRRF
jgi:hypothetical protein